MTTQTFNYDSIAEILGTSRSSVRRAYDRVKEIRGEIGAICPQTRARVFTSDEKDLIIKAYRDPNFGKPEPVEIQIHTGVQQEELGLSLPGNFDLATIFGNGSLTGDQALEFAAQLCQGADQVITALDTTVKSKEQDLLKTKQAAQMTGQKVQELKQKVEEARLKSHVVDLIGSDAKTQLAQNLSELGKWQGQQQNGES